MDRKSEKLVAAYQEGRLIEVAYEMSHGCKENRLSVSGLLAELHNCRVPCDYIPKRSYPLFRTRQILNDWLTQNLEEA